jgi:hypothetical protein
VDNIKLIRDALAKYYFVGIRGLNGLNATKKYRRGQYLKRSYDLWDDRGFTYKPQVKTLPGTSCFLLSDDMSDNDILVKISTLKTGNYADFGKGRVCLVAGDSINRDDAYDEDEVLLSNDYVFNRRGAIFVDYLD